MIIGAQLYTVREGTQTAQDMRETLRKVKDIGYNCVQLSGQSPTIPFTEMAAMCRDLGLTVGSTHISFKRMLEDIDGVIADHEAVDCVYPGVGGMPGEYATSAEGFAAFAKEANLVGKKLRDAGMTFVYHNHHYEYIRFGDESGMDILFREFSGDVQFELDTHWVQAGGASPAAWIQKVSGRGDVVHFKDMVYDPEEKCGVICEIGSGNLDWPGIFEACRNTGVRYAFVEQDDPNPKRSRMESLAMSYAYLKKCGMKF